ncbi:hypothetical protein KPLM21_1050043 [Klebsiella pneumoniae]|nr:hypothetical protein KPNJ1_05488 [Klebsiella pneumoniae 30660/NJST258_1]CED73026.1 hypothetical protein KPLM21_1050043 [Klebsiella pneumoniae]
MFRAHSTLFAQEFVKFKQIPFSMGDFGIKTC